MKGLIEKRSNILFDHGGSAPEHPDVLKLAAEHYGYNTFVINVTVLPEEAKRRIKAREISEGRHTPPHYVDERLIAINELVPRYASIADAIFRFDNSDSAPNNAAISRFCARVANYVCTEP